jgi:hypothetical protein
MEQLITFLIILFWIFAGLRDVFKKAKEEKKEEIEPSAEVKEEGKEKEEEDKLERNKIPPSPPKIEDLLDWVKEEGEKAYSPSLEEYEKLEAELRREREKNTQLRQLLQQMKLLVEREKKREQKVQIRKNEPSFLPPSLLFQRLEDYQRGIILAEILKLPRTIRR